MQVVRRVVIVVVAGSVSDRDCNGGSDACGDGGVIRVKNKW